ncbi:LysR family transcriptional regulator [Sphingomonas histidinilytica]|uniref:LysR family transcriptional regulator, regulator for genes of the gallate degradation pathway n=1 Tax=Rhizorhabdus histidinilytica TaxID=439228 RepID=A0A1T5EJ60_9SPHN|nr:LysR family transcriptional regulator [Rhizorhabdus histidinilytica]MBO9380605.1 LysR family transcriptional regulator [Rhizorhabdus histidinilytica]QEH76776.1 LysR family transcriptional regulator [Sphingomonas sp. C8-2]SKB83778.1 LysR family transcriptional regulator, regulator for genes of the gallate degradation pathway [Rhizorhabdus histidinilytica]
MILPSSRQLSHFLAVVENGSLGRAAKVLNISEPALSKNIRLLEELLEVKLFDRNPRGLDLTTFGTSLFEHARVVMTELQRAVTEIQELKGTEAGHVHVGAGPTFAASLVPRAVAALLADRPNLRISVFEGYSDVLIPMVLRGDLDFALVTLDASSVDPDIGQECLTNDEAVVVARASHPIIAQSEVSLDQLADISWMLPKRPDLLRRHVEKMFLSAGRHPPRAIIEYVSAGFARSMLLEYDILSFLPESLIKAELDSGRLVRVPLSTGVWTRQVGVIFRKRGSQSPAARALLREIRNLLS